ncbi:hypothetical protein OUZ56_001073 [Daphnia magna]|uniref:Uncharacterized protein n=1 Tax=Daphnia magna TaxID=35525 RepID=A0ABR0A1K2_9CRUS|nr:hypothetical protein OUZ56_001073 [Daphnia magna]
MLRAIQVIPNFAQRALINSKHVRKYLTTSALLEEGAITLSQYFHHHVEDEDDEISVFLELFIL